METNHPPQERQWPSEQQVNSSFSEELRAKHAADPTFISFVEHAQYPIVAQGLFGRTGINDVYNLATAYQKLIPAQIVDAAVNVVSDQAILNKVLSKNNIVNARKAWRDAIADKRRVMLECDEKIRIAHDAFMAARDN